LFCITCMLILTNQWSYTMFHRCLFLELWWTFIDACLLSHATFLEYPCHTFCTLQKTDPKTFFSTSSFHKENVDNNFLRNITRNSHSEHIPRTTTFQSLTLSDHNVQHFISFYEKYIASSLHQFLPPHQ